MTRFLTLAFLPLLTLSASVSQVKSGQVRPAADSNQRASGKASSDLAPSQIFNRARPAVVIIVADDQNSQREALGSGFLVSRDRIATNHHVVDGMKEAYVLFSDGAIKRVSGVVADSLQQDLIILRVETGNRPSLPFGDELSLQQGDPVYALGAPKGLELSFTNGIVSSFRKSDAQFLIQTTAPIAPGSSGGPLFDRADRVIGVTTSMLSDAPGIYFSVGIGDLRRLLRTPQSVALTFDEWAKQQNSKDPSESPNGMGPRQSQESQASTPSLLDTISWMQDFSQAHGFAWRNGKMVAKNAFFSDPEHQKPSAAGCAAWATHDFFGVEPGAVKARVAFFFLRYISPDSIKVDEYSDVQFETSDSSPTIDTTETLDPSITSKQFFSPEGWAKGHAMGSLSWMDWLSFDSPESALRFANALKHAVVLCGGVKPPF